MNGSKTPNKPSKLNPLQTLLQDHPEIKHIRFHTVDYGAILRARLAPTSRALLLASKPGTGPTTGSPIQHAAFPTEDLAIEWVDAGTDTWVPDWSSVRACGYAEGHAMVMCDVREPNGTVERDPRSVLKALVRDAREKHGLEFRVGCEIEFVVLPSATSEEPISTGNSLWTSCGLRSPAFSIVTTAVEILEAHDIPVWIYHDEGANGKFEIATCPKDPVAAIDALVYAQDCIKSVAASKGYHVTMHPKPFERGPTCGSHMHVSHSKPEKGDAFLAGILSEMRGLAALWCPGIESFQRQGQYGGSHVMYGTHKFHPVRRIEAAYYEFRMPDCLANPYLALAGIIAAGMHGVDNNLPLTQGLPDKVLVEPDEATRKACGITEALPLNVAEAVAAFRASDVLKERLGERLWERYAAFVEKSAEFAQGKTTKERREMLIKYI